MKKLIPCLIVLMFMLTGCFAGNPYFCEPFKREVDGLTIMFSPKTELMSVLSVLSGEEHPDITNEETVYRNDIITKFHSDTDHEAVKLYKEKNFDYSMMCQFALMINDNFTMESRLMNFKENDDCTEDEVRVLKYVSDRVPIDELLQSLLKFHVDANFENFFKRNKNYFNETLDSIVDEFENYDLVPWVNEFFKNEDKSYEIYLQPIRTNTFLSERIQTIVDPDYNVHYKEKTDIFTTPSLGKYLATNIVNEISTVFVDELSRSESKNISQYGALYDNIPQYPKDAGFESWYDIFNKHITEAVAARFVFDKWGEEEYKSYIDDNIKWGILYQAEFAEALAEYQKNIDDYDSVSDVYPEIYASLEKYM